MLVFVCNHNQSQGGDYIYEYIHNLKISKKSLSMSKSSEQHNSQARKEDQTTRLVLRIDTPKDNYSMPIRK